MNVIVNNKTTLIWYDMNNKTTVIVNNKTTLIWYECDS